MGAKKKGAPAPRPRSGFVTEEQRHTERLTLRLDKVTMGRIRSIAVELGLSHAKVIKQAFEAFERELDAEQKQIWHDGELRAVPSNGGDT